MNKVIFLFFIFLIQTAGIYSQQVWPVQVTGSIIPPHSLDLKVYGNDRSTDLNFQVLLNDPEELALQVIPILTIEQNGNVIYQTDMNYSANPITLNQFSSYLLDGAALNQYLSAEALSGNNGIGKGATLIPEGFTQVCLQMYGVDRTVPVSNKFCVSGNFRLNQPPQIIKPAFNEKIKMPPAQNMLFSWMPMHLSSGNNPGAVEYFFEMVELPMAVMNANDAFESALKIYNTTVMSTSFIYSQAEPNLKPNTYYAWRVTARSIMFPTSLLFQNEGKSEISMFVMYDGEAPSNDVNPFDKLTPRGCSVYETSYGPINKSDNAPSLLSANQKVKLGYFDMQITEVNGTQEANSGKGLVDYPMLRSRIPVEFKNIKVNKEGRVYESENIQSITGADINISMDYINEDNVRDIISREYVDKIYNKINNENIVSKIPEGSSTTRMLPLALNNVKYQNELTCVTGIYFTPSSAYLNLVSKNKNEDIFAATAVPSTPYGIKSSSYLSPIHISNNKDRSDKITESIYSGGMLASGSKIYCDCNGYNALKAKTALSISPNIIRTINDKSSITLISESPINNTNSYIGKVKLSSDFEINGLEGYKFSPKEAYLDLDVANKIKDADILSTSNLFNAIGRGIMIKDAAVALPDKYNFINQTKGIILDKGNIIINEERLESGFLYQNDVLSIKDGKMGPWPFSIDSVILDINNQLQDNLRFSGKLKTPYFEDEFSYQGKYIESSKGNTRLNAIVSQPRLSMPMWKGDFLITDKATIDAIILSQDNKMVLSPKCNFNGNLSIKLSDSEFRKSILNENKSETIDELLKLLDLRSLDFDLQNLNIQGLSNDPFNSSDKRHKVQKIESNNTTLQFGGQVNKLNNAIFIKEGKDDKQRLVLKMVIVKGKSKIELIIWSKIDKNGFEFEGIEIKNIDLKCDCASLDVTPTPTEWNKIINEYYDNHYSSKSITKNYTGSLSNYNSASIIDELKREFEIEKIKSDAIAWFPRPSENKLYIPFLGKNLNVENIHGSFQGVYRDKKFAQEKIKWDESLFRLLSNEESQDLNLPIVVTKEYWNSLGFKTTYTLPDNFKLVISKFNTSAIDKLSSATMTMDLIGELDVEGNKVYAHFATLENIAVGPQKIDLADKIFYLVNEVSLNKNIKYLNTKSTTSGSLESPNSSLDSYASINCSKGLEFFNVVGNYTVNAGTITQLNANSKEAATFGFRLLENRISENNDLLISFMASLKSEYFDSKEKVWKEWQFSGINSNHIKFKAPKQLDAYLDFNENESVFESKSTPNLQNSFVWNKEEENNFIGLIFKNLNFEIPFLETKKLTGDTVETFSDGLVKIASFDQLTQSFCAEYSKVNVVNKENKATLGTWDYTLDSTAFKFENNELDENQLLLKGLIRVPIFKQAPSIATEAWLDKYNDSWIPFFLNVGYSTKIEVSGYLSEIEDKLFESHHIDNLGYKLGDGSSLEIGTEGNGLMARAILNGRIVYTIPKFDATISTLAFENLKLNHNVDQVCRGEFLAGINSIDFGTWSPAPFSDTQLQSLQEIGKNPGKKESKYTKMLKGGFNKIANIDINLQEPKFTCDAENNRRLTLGLELNISRDASNFTAAQQQAYNDNNPEETLSSNVETSSKNFNTSNEAYKAQQELIKKVNNEKKELLKQKRQQEVIYKLSNSIPLAKANADTRKTREESKKKLDEITKKFNESNSKFDLAVKDVKEKSKTMKAARQELKSQKDKLENVKNVRVGKEAKAKTSLAEYAKYQAQSAKASLKNAAQTKTFAITAGGSIDVVFNDKGFKTVELNCLKLGGSFGPVSFEGGINIFRENTMNQDGIKRASTTEWGNGFMGLVKLRFQKMEFQTKFQTGAFTDSISPDKPLEDNRYWFADLAAYKGDGFVTIPKVLITLTGVGGGFYYNMRKERDKIVIDPAKSQSDKTKLKDNNKCALEGLQPGESLSGLKYKRDLGSYGGYLLIEFSHKTEVAVGEIIASLEVKNDSDGFRFKNFGLDITGMVLHDGYENRKNAPILIKGFIELTREVESDKKVNYSLDGGLKFKIVKQAGPIGIFAPEGASPGLSLSQNELDKWNNVLFKISKDHSGMLFGSWKIPERSNENGPKSGLSFLSAAIKSPLINAKAGLFFQYGNDGLVDEAPKLSYLMGNSEFVYRVDSASPLQHLSKSKVPSMNYLLGLRFQANMNDEFALLKWNANALLGANLQLSRMAVDAKCTEYTDFGFKGGYYTTGTVYADLNMKVSLFVEPPTWMFIPSADFEIFNGKSKALLNFGFPNPSFMTGDVNVSYSILGGWKKGNETVHIDIGKKPCAIVPNPVVGVKIINNILPANGTTDIKFLKNINVTTNIPHLKKFDIDKSQFATAGADIEPFSFYYQLSDIDLIEKDSKAKVKFIKKWNEDNTSLIIEFTENLKENTKYQFTQKYEWVKIPKMNNGSPQSMGTEVDTIEFSTGEFDDIMDHNMVISSIPGNGQRYWHKSYAYPHILLINDEEAIYKIFPKDRFYIYYVDITEYKPDGVEIDHRVKVLRVPETDIYKRYWDNYIEFTDRNVEVYENENYRLHERNIIEMNNTSGFPEYRIISFPELDKINLSPGSLCHFRLVRAIPNVNPEKVYLPTVPLTYDINTFTNEHTDSTRIIYEFYFGVSKYNSLKEKFKDAQVGMLISPNDLSACKRNIGLSKEMLAEYIELGITDTTLEIPADTYWGFEGANEKFDKYDIEQLQARVTVKYDEIPDHLEWYKELRNQYYNAFAAAIPSMYNDEIKYQYTLNTVNTSTPLENDFYNRYRTRTNPNYNEFFLSPIADDLRDKISLEEITAKKLLNKANSKSGATSIIYGDNKNSNYDFYLEEGLSSTTALKRNIYKKALKVTIPEYAFTSSKGTVKSGSREIENRFFIPSLPKPIHSKRFPEDVRNQNFEMDSHLKAFISPINFSLIWGGKYVDNINYKWGDSIFEFDVNKYFK